MLNLKCKVKFLKGSTNEPHIEAILLDFVKTQEYFVYSESLKLTTDVAALVKLETFDKGKVYQLPIDCITLD